MAVSGVERLARIELRSADAEGLARFYQDVLGFERLDVLPDASNASTGTVRLKLDATRVDLVGTPHGCRPYPADVRGWSPLFQHFAIVVSDIAHAMTRLRAATGWRPISTDGPQQLPASSGGVIAFKFRDPEGHPLEFLAWPQRDEDQGEDDAGPMPFLRIDHSAISVADIDPSIAFYCDLGLRVAARSLNSGPTQHRLDAIADAQVDVIALELPSHATPHVELLGYRGDYDRSVRSAGVDDIAATCLVFTVADGNALADIVERHADRLATSNAERTNDRRAALLRDPDGHLVRLEVAS